LSVIPIYIIIQTMRNLIPVFLVAVIILQVGTGFSAGFMKKNLCIFNAKSEKISLKEFKEKIGSADIVYVGETHNQINDHLAQLEVLKILSNDKGNKIVVGFEMLNVTLQPILDDYISRKISEKTFLKKVIWKKEWGFDFNLYKPIFDYIRKKRLKALALNIPKKIVSQIARKGLEGLNEEEKKFLPQKINVPANNDYLSFLKKSFSGHGAPMGKMFKWENYLMSMSAWNEGMGANLVRFLKANPGYSALIIAGNGHVIYNQGIPRSVEERMPEIKNLSIYTEGAEVCPRKPEKEILKRADLIWFINHFTEQKSKKED